MRKVLALLLTLYVAAAFWGRRKEQQGSLTCGCAGDCWCRKPPLSLFRWVFPFGHRLRA